MRAGGVEKARDVLETVLAVGVDLQRVGEAELAGEFEASFDRPALAQVRTFLVCFSSRQPLSVPARLMK
ncbi:MAG: hypothetical protein IJC63_01095 [Myxococcaceae bacterium]|nr:hypothetical protein [Myxococcaceae bacterium]